jgi:hypothetical protein
VVHRAMVVVLVVVAIHRAVAIVVVIVVLCCVVAINVIIVAYCVIAIVVLKAVVSHNRYRQCRHPSRRHHYS